MHEGFDARKYEQFKDLGEMTGVFDPEKVGIFMSHHFCTGHSDELAENQKKTRDWARKLGIRVFDFGTGIAHILIMEEGLRLSRGALCLRRFPHHRLRGRRGDLHPVRH